MQQKNKLPSPYTLDIFPQAQSIFLNGLKMSLQCKDVDVTLLGRLLQMEKWQIKKIFLGYSKTDLQANLKYVNSFIDVKLINF